MHTKFPIVYCVFCVFRNQSYIARIQLAILDHNHHNQREKRKSKSGEVMHHRKYRKQSKKWDVTPLLAPKQYQYIPELLSTISKERENSTVTLKHKDPVLTTQPSAIQRTIAHKPPEDTAELVANKRTRF